MFVARELSPKAKAPKGLGEAVEGAGGDVLRYAAPRARDLPARLSEDAGRRGFRLDAAAARLLVERMGEGTLRLANELDRLALWAGPDGEVTLADLEDMVADTSQEAAWVLSDAIVARDPSAALGAAERLLAQGEAVTPLVYQAARRLRDANAAVAQLEEGTPEKTVEASLRMHPYAAKMLIRRVRDASPVRPSLRLLCDRRPGMVDPRRVGVSGRRGAHARRVACGRRRRRCKLRRRAVPSRVPAR